MSERVKEEKAAAAAEYGIINPNPNTTTTTTIDDDEDEEEVEVVELGNGSQVLHIPRFSSSSIGFDDMFGYLDKHIPWTRPTIHVFGRPCLQPRDTCYVASPGVQQLRYSGYQPHPYPWHDFPPLVRIQDALHQAFPGSCFNTVLLNRYKGGNDYVGWHADDEKLYGPTPQIASLSFGCPRQFLLKKKKKKNNTPPPPPKVKGAENAPPPSKRLKKKTNANSSDQHSFLLKHGSLLLMRGNTQRDWLHSVPKRAKADATRINLTFRRVL